MVLSHLLSTISSPEGAVILQQRANQRLCGPCSPEAGGMFGDDGEKQQQGDLRYCFCGSARPGQLLVCQDWLQNNKNKRRTCFANELSFQKVSRFVSKGPQRIYMSGSWEGTLCRALWCLAAFCYWLNLCFSTLRVSVGAKAGNIPLTGRMHRKTSEPRFEQEVIFLWGSLPSYHVIPKQRWKSCIIGICFLAMVCWSCGRSERDRERTNKLLKKTSCPGHHEEGGREEGSSQANVYHEQGVLHST